MTFPSELETVIGLYQAAQGMTERVALLERACRAPMTLAEREQFASFVQARREEYAERTRMLLYTTDHLDYLARMDALVARARRPSRRSRLASVAKRAIAAAALTLAAFSPLDAPVQPEPPVATLAAYTARPPDFEEYVDRVYTDGMMSWPLERVGITSLRHRTRDARYASLYFPTTHDGNDLNALRGDTVRAPGDGTVLSVRTGPPEEVVLALDNGLTFQYRWADPLVTPGERVARKQAIGVNTDAAGYPDHGHVKVTEGYGVPLPDRERVHQLSEPLDVHCLVSVEERRRVAEETYMSVVSELRGRRHLGRTVYERLDATCRPLLERLARDRHFPDAQVSPMPEIRMPRRAYRQLALTRSGRSRTSVPVPHGTDSFPEPEIRLASSTALLR